MEQIDIHNQARIHSFETFGAVDGPGIRFVIFMQGCTLRCKYCQNRDTWGTNAGQVVSVDEVIKKFNNYKNYILPSGGGLTVTGGEPLLQLNFLITLFTKLKEMNIHTAIDTSGMFDLTADMKKLISLTDLFLLDIKHINPEKCKDLVGFSNEKELKFARFLSENNKKIWIRQVLVPGITDGKEDLQQLKEFIHSLKTVEKVEILPYHDMGRYKWENLDCAYELEDVPSATSADVKRAKEILEIE